MIAGLLRALALFALVGPLAGLAVVIAQDLSSFATANPTPLIFAGYLYGVIPALVTGAFAWSLRQRLRFSSGVISSSLVGAVASAICLAAFVDSDLLLASVVFPGAVAGLVCGLLYFKAT